MHAFYTHLSHTGRRKLVERCIPQCSLRAEMLERISKEATLAAQVPYPQPLQDCPHQSLMCCQADLHLDTSDHPLLTHTSMYQYYIMCGPLTLYLGLLRYIWASYVAVYSANRRASLGDAHGAHRSLL